MSYIDVDNAGRKNHKYQTLEKGSRLMLKKEMRLPFAQL